MPSRALRTNFLTFNVDLLLLALYPPIVIGAGLVLAVVVVLLREKSFRTKQMVYFATGAAYAGIARVCEQLVYGSARYSPDSYGWLASNAIVAGVLKACILASIVYELSAIWLILTGKDRIRVILACALALWQVTLWTMTLTT